MRKKAIHTYKQNPQQSNSCCGLYLKNDKARKPTLQRQLNDIINISGDGVEVKGDTITSLCEVDTFVGAKDGGGPDFVVASRDEEADTPEIMENNVQYQQRAPAEALFLDSFSRPKDLTKGAYMTAASIFSLLRKRYGSQLNLTSLSHFGRVLANIPNLHSKHSSHSTEYLVAVRSSFGLSVSPILNR